MVLSDDSNSYSDDEIWIYDDKRLVFDKVKDKFKLINFKNDDVPIHIDQQMHTIFAKYDDQYVKFLDAIYQIEMYDGLSDLFEVDETAQRFIKSVFGFYYLVTENYVIIGNIVFNRRNSQHFQYHDGIRNYIQTIDELTNFIYYGEIVNIWVAGILHNELLRSGNRLKFIEARNNDKNTGGVFRITPLEPEKRRIFINMEDFYPGQVHEALY